MVKKPETTSETTFGDQFCKAIFSLEIEALKCCTDVLHHRPLQADCVHGRRPLACLCLLAGHRIIRPRQLGLALHEECVNPAFLLDHFAPRPWDHLRDLAPRVSLAEST